MQLVVRSSGWSCLPPSLLSCLVATNAPLKLRIGVVPTTNHFGISRTTFPANLVKVAGGDVESNLLRSAPRCREGRGPRRVYPIRLVRMSHFSNETVFRLKLKRLVNVVDASPHGVHLIRHP